MATLLIAFGLNNINLQATILPSLTNGCHQRVLGNGIPPMPFVLHSAGR
jgi:hypothetical protein